MPFSSISESVPLGWGASAAFACRAFSWPEENTASSFVIPANSWSGVPKQLELDPKGSPVDFHISMAGFKLEDENIIEF